MGYQANLKKNAAETWNKTANTLSSWWSSAATSVSKAINENLGDGMDENNGSIPKLYNKNEEPMKNNKKSMPSLSSDQYFNGQNGNSQRTETDILGMNGNNNINNPLPFVKKSNEKKKSVKM